MAKFGALCFIITAAILVLLPNGCHSNVYTSVMKMKKIPGIETELIRYLDEYLKEIEDSNLYNQDYLKSFLEHSKTANDEVLANPKYVENPINSFRLLRRLTGSWNDVIQNITCLECEKSLASLEFASKIEKLKKAVGLWPLIADFYGASMALIRLKNTYKLPMDKLGEGIIYDSKTTHLSGYEFSIIGDMARERDLVYESILWFNESVNLMQKEPNINEHLIVLTIKKLASAWMNFGMPRKAVDVIQEGLAYDPENVGLKRDLKFYSDAHAKLSEKDKKRGLKRPPHPDFHYYFTYEALCRGQVKSAKEMSKLYCNYRKTENPILWSKVEYANLDPPVVLFHDVINDKESYWMIQTAIRQLSRSVLGDVDKKSGSIFSESRISENAWLADDYQMTQKLGKRITSITGLDASVRSWDTYAEPFQVLNYGLGGMYEPHHDFTRLYRQHGLEDNLAFKNAGDRVATWMFYLSDVEAGGATVFPLIKTRVPAKRGTAAFWYNIKRSGEMDDKSLHAGCPILLGSKWAANKWFRELGQAFRYGCSLDPTE